VRSTLPSPGWRAAAMTIVGGLSRWNWKPNGLLAQQIVRTHRPRTSFMEPARMRPSVLTSVCSRARVCNSGFGSGYLCCRFVSGGMPYEEVLQREVGGYSELRAEGQFRRKIFPGDVFGLLSNLGNPSRFRIPVQFCENAPFSAFPAWTFIAASGQIAEKA
jgi:hypothetical protein